MSSTGKIFNESSNVYQDEAKILFDYYQKAAEKIVKEEEAVENKIKKLEEDKAFIEKKLSIVWYWFLTIILFWVYWIRKNYWNQRLAEVDENIAKEHENFKNIFRDYKVSKLGVAYVPVADQIKYEDKSFIVDYTGTVDHSKVTLQMSRQNALLGETINEFFDMTNRVPAIETSEASETLETGKYSNSIQEIQQHDFSNKFDNALRTISYCMTDLETTSVELPLVAEHSKYLDYLEDYATAEIPASAPIINAFDRERYTESIDRFKDLNKLKESLSTQTAKFEDVLQNLITTIADSVQVISKRKLSSTEKLILSSNSVLYRLLKSPYNHYSPVLEAEEIERIGDEDFDYNNNIQGYDPFRLRESSRVRYNLMADTWTAEDGSASNLTFGVHQIYEEILAPVVQNLLLETRIERLKIYNHIHDMKVSYVNKWHQDVDAFYRSNHQEGADIINNMQKTLSEYVEAFNTLAQLRATESSMSDGNLDNAVVKDRGEAMDVLATFERQAKQFRDVQQEFSDYMDELQVEIEAKADEFQYMEYFDGKLRDGYSNEMAVAAKEVFELDERRKGLAVANPLLAKKSVLPPTPNVKALTYEHLNMDLPNIARTSIENLGKMMEEDYVPEGEVAEEPVVEEPEEEQMTNVEAVAEEAPVEESAEDAVEESAEKPQEESFDEEPEDVEDVEESEDEEVEDEDEEEEEEDEDEEDDEDEDEEEDEEEEDEEEEDEEEEDEDEEEDEEEEDEDEEDDEEEEEEEEVDSPKAPSISGLISNPKQAAQDSVDAAKKAAEEKMEAARKAAEEKMEAAKKAAEEKMAALKGRFGKFLK